MVSDRQDTARVAVIGDDDEVARRLADLYARAGSRVRRVILGADDPPDGPAAAIGDGPVDLAILADGFSPPLRRASGVTRELLHASLRRLTFRPFRLAVRLRPLLAAAGGGRLVLLSRTSAAMEAPDPDGRYLDRPFRAAAHALWRCLSIEWRDEGIACILIVLDEPVTPEAIDRLPATIAAAATGGPGVSPIDGSGLDRPW